MSKFNLKLKIPIFWSLTVSNEANKNSLISDTMVSKLRFGFLCFNQKLLEHIDFFLVLGLFIFQELISAFLHVFASEA